MVSNPINSPRFCSTKFFVVEDAEDEDKHVCSSETERRTSFDLPKIFKFFYLWKWYLSMYLLYSFCPFNE